MRSCRRAEAGCVLLWATATAVLWTRRRQPILRPLVQLQPSLFVIMTRMLLRDMVSTQTSGAAPAQPVADVQPVGVAIAGAAAAGRPPRAPIAAAAQATAGPGSHLQPRGPRPPGAPHTLLRNLSNLLAYANRAPYIKFGARPSFTSHTDILMCGLASHAGHSSCTLALLVPLNGAAPAIVCCAS